MLRLQRSVKILPVGAISITVRLPLACSNLAELVDYHDLKLTDGRTLREDVRQLANEVRNELQPYLIKPNVDLNEDDVRMVPLASGFTGLGQIAMPTAVLQSDFIISNLAIPGGEQLTITFPARVGMMPPSVITNTAQADSPQLSTSATGYGVMTIYRAYLPIVRR